MLLSIFLWNLSGPLLVINFLLHNALQDLPNIGHIEISLEKGEASIEHGRFVSPDDIVQAIADAGFEAAY